MMIRNKIPKNFFEEKKLILVCGSGGVGKTTASASLALKAARVGYKSLVLTIDPAKRLATSLGLKELTGVPTRIDMSQMADFDRTENVHMEAMMLNPKSTFDDLVIRYSPSKDIENKILNNFIYQHLSDMIAGSQEYMAMEKLYELVSENKYDVIIIDTPPTTHAIDFLEAPQKMVNALSHSMIHLLLKPALFVGKSGMKIIEKGSQMILKVFDRITGFAFLQDISEMLLSFQALLGGFEERAAEVKKILSDSSTSFVLVTACEAQSLKEAQVFADKITEQGYCLEGVLLNRVHPYYEEIAGKEEMYRQKLENKMGKVMAEKMMLVYEESMVSARRDLSYRQKLKDMISGIQFLVPVPLFEGDIHDLDGLCRLSENF
ncbi:MAG: anion-transporting ATPase [uncultured bacterium]|nr:MAG: anion-transporting ATPase [uncultured bacterium]